MPIKAHHRREERYEGLQLVHGTNVDAKKQIEEAIEAVKKEMRLNPMVCENHCPTNPEKDAIYIEFDEDTDKDGGEFFEKVLRKLNIDRCC